MGNFERANEIAVLAGGRVANWTEQTGYAPPTLPDSGVALQGALRALVVVDLRETVAHRSAWVTVDTLDPTAVYTITIDGNAAAYDASTGTGTLQEVLEGIRDAINGTPAVAAIVSASVIDADDDTVDDTVLIEGLALPQYTIAESATGTGVLAVRADAEEGDVRIYAAMGGQSATAPPGWRFVNGASFTVSLAGMVERFDVSSFARLGVEVDGLKSTGDGPNVTYQPARIVVGPSLEVTPQTS